MPAREVETLDRNLTDEVDVMICAASQTRIITSDMVHRELHLGWTVWGARVSSDCEFGATRKWPSKRDELEGGVASVEARASDEPGSRVGESSLESLGEPR